MNKVQIGEESTPEKISLEDFTAFINVGTKLANLMSEQVGGDFTQVSVERDGTVRFLDDETDLIDELIYVEREQYDDEAEYVSLLAHSVQQAINNAG